MFEVEAEYPVVGGQGGAEYLKADVFRGLFGQVPADGAVRATGGCDVFVATAAHECSCAQRTSISGRF